MERLRHRRTISPNPQERCGFHQECGSSENAHCERGCSSKRRGRNRDEAREGSQHSTLSLPKGLRGSQSTCSLDLPRSPCALLRRSLLNEQHTWRGQKPTKHPSQVRKRTAKKLEGKRKCENKSEHPIKTGQRSTKPEASSLKNLTKVEKLLMRLMGPRWFFVLFCFLT